MLLVSEQYKGRYESAAKELILEEVWQLLDIHEATDPNVAVDGNDLIYILQPHFRFNRQSKGCADHAPQPG